jgi:hypothetical protein
MTRATLTQANALIIAAGIGLIGATIGGYFVLQASLKTKQLEIDSTQTAEARLTEFAPTFTLISGNNSPTSTPVAYADPKQFVRDYLDLLINRRYQEAWSELSPRFKDNYATNGSGGYEKYVTFWDTVDKVEITLIEIRSQSDYEVYVYTEISYYYKGGYKTTGHTTYKLVKDSSKSSWLFDPN